MTLSGLEHETTAPPRRPRVWPWAVLSAVVVGLFLSLALGLLDLPAAGEIPSLLLCAAVGFAIPYLLAPRPALRIRLLSIAVLGAAAWAAWAYRDNAFLWRRDLGDDALLPWGVSNIPEWAVVAQPVAIGACVAVAIVALVRLARGRLERTAWWTALLALALLVCCSAALQTLLNRSYAA